MKKILIAIAILAASVAHAEGSFKTSQRIVIPPKAGWYDITGVTKRYLIIKTTDKPVIILRNEYRSEDTVFFIPAHTELEIEARQFSSYFRIIEGDTIAKTVSVCMK